MSRNLGFIEAFQCPYCNGSLKLEDAEEDDVGIIRGFTAEEIEAEIVSIEE